jgi:hypothetical protein
MQTNLRSTPQDTKPTLVFRFYSSYKCSTVKNLVKLYLRIHIICFFRFCHISALCNNFVQAVLRFPSLLRLKEHSNKLMSKTSVIRVVKSFLDDEVIKVGIQAPNCRVACSAFWEPENDTVDILLPLGFESWQLGKLTFVLLLLNFNLWSRRLISVCQYDWFPPPEVATGLMLYVIQTWDFFFKWWHCVMYVYLPLETRSGYRLYQ